MTGPVDRAAVDALTARIKRLEDAQKRANRTPQLRRSSMEGGTLTVYQPGTSGLPGTIIGQQFDGTYGSVPVGGPAPPTPSGLTMETANSGVKVTWDGSFEQTTADRVDGRPTVSPLDFKRVAVQVATNPDFTGAVVGGDLISESGGSLYVPWAAGAQVYARAQCWSQSGKFSTWSLTIGPVEAGKVGIGDIGFDLATLGGTRIFYGATDPSTVESNLPLAYGELWLKETAPASGQTPAKYELQRWAVVSGADAWQPVADQRAADAAAQAIAAQTAAAAKARMESGPTPPTLTAAELTTDRKVWWLDTANGSVLKAWYGTESPTGWRVHQFGNGAIQPGSLVASTVLATGSITAPLFSALLVLSTTIIAGNPAGAHARLTESGLRFYRAADLAGQPPEEVGRLGTDGDDFLAVVNSAGGLAASVDDTGAFSGRTANFQEDITVAGRSVTQLLASNRRHTHGYAFAGVSGVTTEIGLVEIAAYMEAGRLYELGTAVLWTRNDAGAELILRIRDGGTDIPTLASPELSIYSTNGTAVGLWSTFQPRGWVIVATTGIHRLLLTAQRQGTGAVEISNAAAYVPAIVCIDHGAHASSTVGSVNRGGGSTAAPVQQFDTGEMVPAGWRTFRGDGSQRLDVNEVVQGWDPSGYNGDGRGYWWWSLPSISGTVDRVDLYLYSSHWYYNSGGTAIINIMPVGTVYPFNKAKADWHVGGYPKPGGKWVTLPSDWWHLFKNTPNGGAGRCDIISLGPSGGSNLAYYGKFSAGAPRLRIWYTQ